VGGAAAGVADNRRGSQPARRRWLNATLCVPGPQRQAHNSDVGDVDMKLRSCSGRLMRVAVLVAAAALVVACANAPKTAAPPPPQPGPGGTAAGAAAGTEVVPEAAPVPSPQVIARTVTTAIEQLELGQEEQAEVALRQVLQAEPGHRQAQMLLKQIKDDPIALLGRDSFPYRVQPGESLSKIAQRFLGDPYLFYGLARYNGIKVPRQLAGGQMIRVPGKAPATQTPTPAPPAPAPAPPPAPTTAPPPVPAPAPSPPPPSRPAETPAQRAEREKAESIARYTREARSAFAKQDLAAAIRAWDRVLELDPNHRTATLERQKAVDLSERLKKVR
jgi:hypothetical protein